MHVRFNFNEVMLGTAKDAYQLNSGVLQSGVVVTVGEGHLAPVHNTLYQNALMTGMNQMGNKIRIINAVNTDFDGTQSIRIFPLAANNLIYMIMDKTFGMIRM